MKQEVFNNLLTLFHEDKLAHAYLLETNDVEECYNQLILFIKRLLCNFAFTEGCTKCDICHLIDEGNIPSIITIEPDGKTIKTEAINNLKKAFSVMPVYIPYNIYIIKYPEKMNDTSYNKLLKFLEEPEDNILGFYITKNKDSVASTIVSRCELLKFKDYSNNNQGNLSDDEYIACQKIAEKYFKKLENNDKNITWFNTTIVLKELTSQEQIVCLLNLIYNTYELSFKKSKDLTVIKKLKIIEKYLIQLNYNMNLSLLMDSFALEMGEVNEL